MSKIGKINISIPEKVKVALAGNIINIEGPLGKKSINVDLDMFNLDIIDGKEISIKPKKVDQNSKRLWGMNRSLINNAVIGSSTGYEKTLELVGVGYRAALKGNQLNLQLGYSHDINFDIPEGIKIAVEKQTTLKITGSDKQLVGEVASKIKTLRKIEPYKGKGVREKGQHILKKEGKKKNIKVTFLPFIIKAVIKSLKEFPRFNSSLDHLGENLVLKNYYNIGIAVDTPTGLVVPVIKNADNKSILGLSEELMDLSERARISKLKPDEFKGGCFTISSLGGIGGTNFTPIINPPEVAIMGVSKSIWKPVYDHENKEIVPTFMMPFSLSYDHRVIDGAIGAAFTSFFSNAVLDVSTFE